MQRRRFLALSSTAALGGALTGRTAAFAEGPWAGLFRSWVPEIFASLPDPPDNTDAIVIGSGFGGAVAALRLAQAGVQTTVLERGSKWPNDPWREIFTGDDLPDGRGFWHRTSFTGITNVPVFFESFGGVLDCTEFAGIDVWRGAAVGGGSVVFTGVMHAPEKRLFDSVFGGVVDYGELASRYYPRVREMLRLDAMPTDVYNSGPFGHSRVWDEQARHAGYTPQPLDSIFNWSVVRSELAGQSRASATAARSNLGNSNGAKFDLNQNYLRYAQETGKATIFPGHEVTSIGRDGKRFTVEVRKLTPTGTVLGTRVLTADRLFLCGGSVGTTELLVRARATGTLPNLNEHVGEGWGTNGDVVLARGASAIAGNGQGVPPASRIFGDSGLPTTLENWYIPGIPVEVGAIASLGMVLDSTRGRFRHDAATGKAVLDWPKDGNATAREAAHAMNHRIAERAGSMVEYDSIGFAANSKFTAHPLGGAVLGKATDSYGRVHGHPGLYVLDGAAIPGSTATMNPSLTISAIAERNIEQILKSGR
ncbi:GMC oxidoreductase [Aldersonia kunmingensis]|uniref:GMC oxidoreductase n=1 Tax=Aldersonia kunmingensis TaxID=408066 RepID=UPI0008327424|nr:GMC oxidoreductase [Aldersonia kunmingensis]